MTDNELQPCPFCWGEANVRYVSDSIKVVRCPTCDAEGPLAFEGLVAEKWNTRPIEAALRVEVARLTAELDTLNEVNRFIAASHTTVTNELRSLHESQQARWIPVSERLPEDGEYLTYGFWHERIVGRCIEGQWNVQGVTHWQPLPEPPEAP